MAEPASVEPLTEPQVQVSEDASDDEYQVISKKAKTAPVQVDSPVNEQPTPAEQIPSHVGPSGDADDVLEDAQEIPVPEQGPVSDADWLRSKTNRVLELVENDELPADTLPSVKPAPTKPTVEQSSQTNDAVDESQSQPAAEDNAEKDAPVEEEEDRVRETGRLYVRNLHYEVTEDELRQQFSKHGALEEVSAFLFHFLLHAMMNVKIGTTDASAFEVTL